MLTGHTARWRATSGDMARRETREVSKELKMRVKEARAYRGRLYCTRRGEDMAKQGCRAVMIGGGVL